MAWRIALTGAAICTASVTSATQEPAAADQAEEPQVSGVVQPSARIPASAKVYFPDEINPESVAAARARAAEQQQLSKQQSEAEADAQFEQVSSGEHARDPIDQLGEGDSARFLAQLSEAEREVLLEAIEGTDICDNPPDIAAIRELCRNRLETRSRDFGAREFNTLSAEERLLGEGLEDTGTPRVEEVIERLARNIGKAENFEEQAIASVALGESAAVEGQGAGTSGASASSLSPETQDLINALIQQLGQNGGG